MTDREQTRRDADEQIEKNMRILKLAREDPGWTLARILRAEELEAELEQAEEDIRINNLIAMDHAAEIVALERKLDEARLGRSMRREDGAEIALLHARLAKVPALVEALREIRAREIPDSGGLSAWPAFAGHLQRLADQALTAWEQE